MDLGHILFLVAKAAADVGISLLVVFILLALISALIGGGKVKLEGLTALIVIFGVAFYFWFLLPPYI